VGQQRPGLVPVPAGPRGAPHCSLQLRLRRAGLGLLQCRHLSDAYSTLLTASAAASASSSSGTAEATAAPAAAAHVLNVSSLNWACSQARRSLAKAWISLALRRACLLTLPPSVAGLTLLLPASSAGCR
jgi:hypothetical protein